MIPLDIDLLSNGFKNHPILRHFCGVFEQLDSSSFCAFMAAEPQTNCCHTQKRTAVIYGSGAQVSSSRGTGMNFSYR
jgi:hypothetical protein